MTDDEAVEPSSAPVILTGEGDSVTVHLNTQPPPSSVWTLESTGVSGKFSLGAVTSYGIGKYYDPAVLSGVMSKLNAMCMRDGVEWKKLETTAGVYNWSASYGLWVRNWFSHLADVQGRQALSGVLNAGTLYSDFQWGGPPTGPSGVLHWQNYVRSVVGTLSPLGCHNYEMWNEANVQSTGGWGGTRQQFIDLIKPTYDAMKALDPSANLALAALINPNNNAVDGGHGTPQQWLIDLAKANYSQMPDTRICYHNYYDGSKTLPQLTPEEFHAQDMMTHNLIAPYRAWETVISEVGWYTKNNKYVSEDTRAQYWSRYPFLLRATPGVRIVTAWEMVAATSPEYALYDANMVASPGAVSFGNAALHVNAASDATHSTLNTSHCVMLKCPERRYALWDHATSKVLTVAVTASTAGTLTTTNTASGTSTTKALTAGTQNVNVTIGPAATVLTANVAITIDGVM